MSLRECQECGGNVSTNASFCPHCGTNNPIRYIPTPKTLGRRLAELFGLLVSEFADVVTRLVVIVIVIVIIVLIWDFYFPIVELRLLLS